MKMLDSTNNCAFDSGHHNVVVAINVEQDGCGFFFFFTLACGLTPTKVSTKKKGTDNIYRGTDSHLTSCVQVLVHGTLHAFLLRFHLCL